MFETLRQDLKCAFRSLVRERGVAAVAILSLALGIAANATVFSLLQAVEFPRLIYPDASRIVFLESRNAVRGLVGMPISAPDGVDIAASSHTLLLPSVAADQTSLLYDGSTTRRVSGRRVMATFFDVMRVQPTLGRVLTAADREGTLVLGDGMWRTAFRSDPSVIGRPFRLDGGTVSIVGVMPARFDADADFWVPLSSSFGRLAGFARDDRQYTLFARLAPTASIADATRELGDISRRLAGEQPATNKDWVTFPTPLPRMHGRDARGAFLLLQGAVAVVLLIACANIANILLARGTRRRHEMALRMSLGARRGRLVRGLLIESVLLSIVGGAIGVVLAMWGIRLSRVVGGFPEIINPTLNLFVLGFTAALSMLTGIACGLVPALRASGVAPETVLRAEGGRAELGQTRGRLRSGLVGIQVACAVVLATCGALMLRTLMNRERVDLGFDPGGAIRADLSLNDERYRDPTAVRATVDELLRRLAERPDVLAAGVVTWALPTGAGAQRQLTLPSEHDRALASSIRRGVEAVTPAYFAALGAPLRIGRLFTGADRAGAAPVAIVNEELARQLWPNRNPVGEPLRLGAPAESPAPIVTVVGVVRTIRRSAMHDVVVARVYLPYAQYPNRTMSIVVRPRGSGPIPRALEDAAAQTDPSALVEGLRTVEADLAQFTAPIRLITTLLTAFGLVGLLLAALGVFGTMSYAVSQREREMAVRSALGADRRDIIRLVFGSALRVTAVGVTAGLAAAAVAGRALGSFLYGVSATDPLTFAVVAGVLLLVSLAACYRPARLAATSDPMTILRG